MLHSLAKNNKNIFLRSFFNNGLNTFLVFIFGFLSTILFTRLFGVKIFGEFTLLTTYSTIIYSIVTIGINSGFKRELIWFSAKNKNPGNYILLILFFSIISNLIFLLIFFLFKDNIENYISIDNDLIYPLILVLIINIFIFSPSSFFLYIFEGFQEVFPLVYINLLSNIIKIVVIIFFYYYSVNLYSGIISFYLIPNIFLLFLSFFIAKFKFKIKYNFYKLCSSIDKFKNSLNFSFKLFPLMVSELIIGNIVIVFLSQFSSVEYIGQFRIILSLYIGLNMIPLFFSKVLQPMMTKFFFNNQYSLMNIYYNFSFKTCLLLISFFSISFVLFSNEIIMLYGINSSYLVNCLIIFSISNIFLSGSSLGTIYTAYNKPIFLSFFLFLGAFSNLILGYFLVKYFDILGATLTIALSNIITQFSMHFHASRYLNFKLPYKAFIMNLLVLFLLFSLIFLSSNIILNFLIKLIFLIFILIFYFYLITYFNFFSKNELLKLRNLSDHINILFLRNFCFNIFNYLYKR